MSTYNSEQSRMAYRSAADALQRMSDSQISAIAKKLQEYFALKLYESDWGSYNASGGSNTFPTATLGSIDIWTQDRSSGTDVTKGGTFADSIWATKTASNPDTFGYPPNDDDTFTDPGTMDGYTRSGYYLLQKHNPNYSNFRNNGEVMYTGVDSGSEIGYPGEWLRQLGHCMIHSGQDGTWDHGVRSESGASGLATLKSLLFDTINSSIRSTASDAWGKYYVGTSNPGGNFHGVPYMGGLGPHGTQSHYNGKIFEDHHSSLSGTSSSVHQNYYLYLNIPNESDYTGDITNPLRIVRWKITRVGGTGVDDEGSHAGVNEYWAYGPYGNIGDFFYIKSNGTNGDYYVSTDLTNPTSSSSFGSTSYDAQYDNGSGIFYPTGSTANGYVRVIRNDRFAGSFVNGAIYKVERDTVVRDIVMPNVKYYDATYDFWGYRGYGSSETDYDNQASYRNDLQNSWYIMHFLYRVYTQGRYYPIYTMSAGSAGTGEYNHGTLSDTRIGDSTGTVHLSGPTDGTYYRTRKASGSVTNQLTVYLKSSVS